MKKLMIAAIGDAMTIMVRRAPDRQALRLLGDARGVA